MTMGIKTKQVGQENDYANSNRYLRMRGSKEVMNT